MGEVWGSVWGECEECGKRFGGCRGGVIRCAGV